MGTLADLRQAELSRGKSRFAACPSCKVRHWADDLTTFCRDCWFDIRGTSPDPTDGWHVNICERCDLRMWSRVDRPFCARCHQVPTLWRATKLRTCRDCNGTYRGDRRGTSRCEDCVGMRAKHMRHARTLGNHTRAQWLQLLAEHGFMCVYCGVQRATSKDHIIPISKGGSNAIENIAPACLACNSSKGDRSLKQWIAKLGAA